MGVWATSPKWKAVVRQCKGMLTAAHNTEARQWPIKDHTHLSPNKMAADGCLGKSHQRPPPRGRGILGHWVSPQNGWVGQQFFPLPLLDKHIPVLTSAWWTTLCNTTYNPASQHHNIHIHHCDHDNKNNNIRYRAPTHHSQQQQLLVCSARLCIIVPSDGIHQQQPHVHPMTQHCASQHSATILHTHPSPIVHPTSTTPTSTTPAMQRARFSIARSVRPYCQRDPPPVEDALQLAYGQGNPQRHRRQATAPACLVGAFLWDNSHRIDPL